MQYKKYNGKLKMEKQPYFVAVHATVIILIPETIPVAVFAQ
jgi:hypothetical protein